MKSQSVQRPHLILSIVFALCLLFPASTFAQDMPDPDITPEAAEQALKQGAKDGSKDGWRFELNLGANASLNHSSKVVGATDGLTMQIGVLFGFAAHMVSGRHEWSNHITAEHGQTKTPLIDSFIKSTDNLELKSLYVFRVVDWFGPFGRVKMNTQVLPGYDIRAEAINLSISNADGTTQLRQVEAQKEIGLTSAFEPFVLVESVGALATPINTDPFRFDAKLGIGGQHIFTSEGYAIVDDADTPELELKQLETSHAMGGEFELEMGGKISSIVTWSAIASFFYPFVTSGDQGLSGVELLHSDLGATLSVKLSSWLSLDYNLSAKRLPLVVDEWQIQNLLLLTAGFNFVWPEDAPTE